jgi:AcrR family transcriptional regulator
MAHIVAEVARDDQGTAADVVRRLLGDDRGSTAPAGYGKRGEAAELRSRLSNDGDLNNRHRPLLEPATCTSWGDAARASKHEGPGMVGASAGKARARGRRRRDVDLRRVAGRLDVLEHVSSSADDVTHGTKIVMTAKRVDRARDDRAGGATRERILDATLAVLGRFGQRKLSMTEVADAAGVSRPTLYRYFPTKEELLEALAHHEQHRFDNGLSVALRGARTRAQRLDSALRYIVAYSEADPARRLLDIEPRFMLERLQRALRPTAAAFDRSLGSALSAAPVVRAGGATTRDLAELIVRIALSNFLLPPTDPDALLQTLRVVVGLRVEAAA